ncbi:MULTISPECIES: ABC transporter ATP-binding protein [unclassified Chelatococcus]|uniref:ABC transporter ATP-binding protein n=1 Tax=unclassified Chelatococcus TaxID=2638111 RepID=UPI0020BEA858|nr:MULTISPECIES: ABC transporter ATP-binding protein [unclassified Chelatococcus]MCO5075379.1 ABC transporter ATP-binding protein [Chelatococcus sp.]CAH1656288.1 Spermidine/putrescine import ATP-binding protein PotA [Hyphomicrobiales bacterium]CAH1695799.1 Spermidine/putrescine import ATP-binding protein PotA [Hyphomicrobiales bacterium]
MSGMSNSDALQARRSLTPPKGEAIAIKGISKRFGQIVGVDGVDLHVEAGEFLSLLGPSGSGKTTLLMMLAGFETPSSGTITLGSRDLTHVPPNRRGIGMVFQRYALFPHMSVAQNVAFPLKMRGLGRADIAPLVDQALARVRLQDYGDRSPAQLSGGQQQRVAVARALVFQPPVLLMDEPLGALDKKLREELQIEIKKLHASLGITIIYVTHDQEEALTMSDRIAVMDKGRIKQLGSPVSLYHEPNSSFVADFIGKMNFLKGVVSRLDDRSIEVMVSGQTISVARSQLGGRDEIAVGRPVRIAARPESLSPAQTGEGAIAGEIETSIFLGSHRTLIVRSDDGTQLQVQVPSSNRDSGAEMHGRAFVRLDPSAVRVFAGEG